MISLIYLIQEKSVMLITKNSLHIQYVVFNSILLYNMWCTYDQPVFTQA